MADFGPRPDDRIEWGHRPAADHPMRDVWLDGHEISECPGWPDRKPGPPWRRCELETMHDQPWDHLWRRVTVTVSDWEPGEPPALDAETTAGTAENLRALYRLLAPYRCCGDTDSPTCDSRCGWVGLGLPWNLSKLEVKVREELERQEKADG